MRRDSPRRNTVLPIEVVKALDLASADIARWAELQRGQTRLDSPFLSPQWALLVAKAQGEKGQDVKVAIQRGPEGEALAFLPARVRQDVAMPVGAPMCDYQALISAPGVAMDPRELLAALGVDRIDFCHMMADDETLGRHARGQADSWVVETPDGYEAYAAERKDAGVGVLKDIDKKRRKAEREVGPCRFTAMSESRAAFDQLIAWKRVQLLLTHQTDLFKAPWVNKLLNDVFARRDPDFGGGLYTLHLGERLAAVHLHLRGEHTIHGWLIAHNPDLERYSPGLMLFQDILKSMDGTPYMRLDLGAGDYRFKRELSNARQTVVFGFLGSASMPSLVRHAAYGVRSVAEALPLGRISEIPGKAMRRMDLLRGLH
jgi:CelD/BcsL family acetyltransferase involved in cellulose biosynthesis